MPLLSRLFLSLKTRFIIFVVLILTLVVGTSSYFHLQIQYNQLMDISREKLRDLAETIENSIKTSMQAGKSDEVKSILEAVGTLSDLEKVRIFSRDGIVLVSSQPGERGRKVDAHDLEAFHEQRFSTVYHTKNLERPNFYIVKPIMNEPACYPCHGNNPNQINGILDVEVSMEKVHQRVSTLRKFMMTSAAATLTALVLAILYLMSRLVSNPIRKLITTMRKAETGDLSVRVEPDKTLEFNELGQNFNSMISKLEKAQEDLKHLHEEQMERVDRFATIGELAAGIAHEIKNPIAGIGGAIQVLTDELAPGDHRREIFAEILNQIDRIDQDVKDLLSYARTAKPTLAECDINKVVQQVLFLVRDRAAQQQVHVDVKFDESIPKIEIDDKQIQQVLVNLTLNGIQAMPEGGTLTLATGLHNNADGPQFVEIEVQDSGRGIPPEIMRKIFTPFFTTRHTGTGLGLPISQKIVHQHEGKIEVKSEAGQGTSFKILLPLSRIGATV